MQELTKLRYDLRLQSKLHRLPLRWCPIKSENCDVGTLHVSTRRDLSSVKRLCQGPLITLLGGSPLNLLVAPVHIRLTDGISLFGRDTPAYILEEVGRRQAADRGTSSIWAKLAADYGPRHANFIVKHNTKFPISRNDRNRQDLTTVGCSFSLSVICACVAVVPC